MADTKLTRMDEVCQIIAKKEAEYRKALPKQILSAKFIRTAETYLRLHPSLMECQIVTLYAAIQEAAQDGLLIDGRDGALIPFKGRVKWVPMVGGICKRARNSGEIKSIAANVVYKNDEYDHWIDETGEHFKHRPGTGERGKAMLTYAFCQTKDGGVYFEEISEEEMGKIEKMAQASDSPWNGAFKDEMKKKSALRRLLKYRVPSSSDLDKMIRSDDEIYDAPVATKPAETTSSRLRDAVVVNAEPAPVGMDSDEVAAREELPL